MSSYWYDAVNFLRSVIMIPRLLPSCTGHAAPTTIYMPRNLPLWRLAGRCLSRNSQPIWASPVAASRGLTTHALGTLYEAHCLASLQRLIPGLTLQQVGGAGDRGVDLRGWIQPADLAAAASASSSSSSPSQSQSSGSGEEEESHRSGERRVRVVVQCKATNRQKEKKLGPVILRELEGVMGRITRSLRDGEDTQEDVEVGLGVEGSAVAEAAPKRNVSPEPSGSVPPTLTSTSILAILCSSSGFSKQTMLQATNQVEGNVMLVHLPLPEEVSRRLALEGLTIGDDPQASQSREEIASASASASSSETSPDPTSAQAASATVEVTQKETAVMRPISILLSSKLRTGTSGRSRGSARQRDPLAGRLSVGTRRSLEEGGGEAPFLLWDGMEIVG